MTDLDRRSEPTLNAADLPAAAPRAPSSSGPVDPPPAQGNALRRGAVAALAAAVLVVIGWQGWRWFSHDPVGADDESPAAAAPAEAPPKLPPSLPSVRAPDAPPAPVGRTIRPPQPQTPVVASNEPPAPAVTGQAIRKCVVNGEVTYTNEACPEGSQPEAVTAGQTDPNGVAGSTGDAPVAMLPRVGVFAAGADPNQAQALCRHLVAEANRLDYEFRQPLPPPVLDHIATRLRELRDRAASVKCALPKPSAESKSPAKAKSDVKTDTKGKDTDAKAKDSGAKPAAPVRRPAPRPAVVEEKAGDDNPR